MRKEDMDLTEMPDKFSFYLLMDKEKFKWVDYCPTTIEADIPFEDHWYKYVYWIPKIKKEFYTIALTSPDIELAVIEKCHKLGMDYAFFCKYYNNFLKRLQWMRQNGEVNIMGETK